MWKWYDMSKIDWTAKTKEITAKLESLDEDDIHKRQLRGNIFFIDMKLPRPLRFAFIKESLWQRTVQK